MEIRKAKISMHRLPPSRKTSVAGQNKSLEIFGEVWREIKVSQWEYIKGNNGNNNGISMWHYKIRFFLFFDDLNKTRFFEQIYSRSVTL